MSVRSFFTPVNHFGSWTGLPAQPAEGAHLKQVVPCVADLP